MSGTPVSPHPGRRRALVVGVGSPDRGDDAVGAAVARAVAAHALLGVSVVEHEDPTALLDLWAGHDTVVVVDAARSGSAPGTVHVWETGAGLPPFPERSAAGPAAGGSHGLGVVATVELARALDRLPRRVVLVGVEADRFEHGAGLSPPVAAAVPHAAERAVTAIRATPRR